jgi:hypothetical protein
MTRIWADLGVRLSCRTGEGTRSMVISIAFAGVCYYQQ